MSNYSRKENPRVYFDLAVGDPRFVEVSRVQMELFANVCPVTAENFRALCTGEKGKCRRSPRNLHFLNSVFHRVIAGFMAQGGDFTNFDGTGGESIYGEKFKDENFKIPHTEPFLLSMANAGKNTNGSQFFITFAKTPHLNGKHCVFGRVEKGHEILRKIERSPVNSNDKPKNKVTITKCGQLIKKSELVKKQQVAAGAKKQKQQATPVKEAPESGSDGSDSEEPSPSGSSEDNAGKSPKDVWKQAAASKVAGKEAEVSSVSISDSADGNDDGAGEDSGSSDSDKKSAMKKDKLAGLMKAKENSGSISKKALKNKARKMRLKEKFGKK